jgi:hypothetical protein
MLPYRVKDRGTIDDVCHDLLVLGDELGHQIEYVVEKTLRDDDDAVEGVAENDVALGQNLSIYPTRVCGRRG